MEDSNRSSTNPNLTDGFQIKSRSGKTYTLKQYQIKEYIDRDGIEKQLIVYSVKDNHKKNIGNVTQYTTMERLQSLVNRYEEPNHMAGFEFIARIGETNKLPYVVLPEPLRAWNDVLVDDELSIEITNTDGQTITDICHHVSMIKTTYIVNLSRMRRYVLDDDGNQSILSTEEYKKINKSKLFIKKGMLVKIKVIPETNVDFNLADSMIEDVDRLIKKTKANN